MKIETNDKFKKIIPEDGFVLTSFKDGDDILNYASAKVMYVPLNANLENLREISVEENDNYIKLQEESFEELNKSQNMI